MEELDKVEVLGKVVGDRAEESKTAAVVKSEKSCACSPQPEVHEGLDHHQVHHPTGEHDFRVHPKHRPSLSQHPSQLCRNQHHLHQQHLQPKDDHQGVELVEVLEEVVDLVAIFHGNVCLVFQGLPQLEAPTQPDLHLGPFG